MKRIMFGVAALALLAGCSKNEEGQTTSDMISLSATTTRASIAKIDDLQANGFKVWATTANAAGWYAAIDGISHTYNNVGWDFSTPKPWPTDQASYEMTFFAVYPPSTTTTETAGTTPGSQIIAADFTVPATAATQIDLLGSKAIANIKPANGNLAMVFYHLLSKVDFGMEIGQGFAASVQGLTINNVGNRGTYTFTGTPSWTTVPSVYTSKYAYYGTIYDNPTGHSVTLENAQYSSSSDGTVVGFYTESTSPKASQAHMMLMPQVNKDQFWGAGSAPSAVPATESYVCLVYRLRQDGHDLIGFANAQSHRAFEGSELQAGGYSAMDPLFVKVGYPFDLQWTPGKGYTYNLNFGGADGATGGYLLDQNYYDKYGNRTDLLVGDTDGDGDPDGPTPPDPMLDGENIHLIPIVTPWDDADPSDLN